MNCLQISAETLNRGGLAEMMRRSEGKREVPVIVEGEKVALGYGGSLCRVKIRRGTGISNGLNPRDFRARGNTNLGGFAS